MKVLLEHQFQVGGWRVCIVEEVVHLLTCWPQLENREWRNAKKEDFGQ